VYWYINDTEKERKERKSIYIAPLYSVSKHSDMDHTVLPANYTMPACLFFVSVHQMAPPLNVVANI